MMNTRNLLLFPLFGLTLLASGQSPLPDLARQFESPPDASRPWVYWYFMDGNLSREGMTADLESMKRAGLGGGIFLEVNLGIPRGPVDFMSGPWRELLKHAGSEAERLGLQLALGSGPGWCGTGGPWVKPEQSMQHLVASETRVQGPRRFGEVLPQPKPRTPFFGEGTLTPELKKIWAEFYQDVAVVAFPTPAGGYRIPDVDEKALFRRAPYSSAPGVKPRLVPDTTVLPEDQNVPLAKIIDLTNKLTVDGRLVWEVPDGNWTVLRLGRTLTGQTTRPSPQPGIGLESDKFDKAALDAHFDHFVGSLLKTVGEPKGNGKGFTTMHFDSWEMSSQNWSAAFRDEFKRRRGYDPLRFLPAMFGHPVGGVRIAERFLWDLRLTAQELVKENHVSRLKELAGRHHMNFSAEPYDMNPAGDLALAGVADVPMCEFWSRNYGFSTEFSCFEAVSAAHTNGRKIVGAEAFTSSNDQWRQYPWAMKQQGDWALCNGINRFVFHRFQHQPEENRYPGMTFGYTHGVHWERTQTWWDMADGYHGYLSRCQTMLRRGLPVADILYLDAEGTPEVFTYPKSATRNGLPDRKGYQFDGCSPEALVTRANAKDGRIVFPDGMSYRTLVLPRTGTMTPKLAGKVRDIAAAGVPVLGKGPIESPGLQGYPGCDAEVLKAGEEMQACRNFVVDGWEETADLQGAKWIWSREGNPAAAAPVGTRWFKRDLEVDPGFDGVSLAVTADNEYEVFINGRSVATGDDFHRIAGRDVTTLLKAGKNRVRIRVTNTDLAPNPAGLIASIAIRMPGKMQIICSSDSSWTSSPTEDGADAPVMELGGWNMAPWGLSSPSPAREFYPDYETVAGLLEKQGLPPDFESNADLRHIHRREADAEIYFVGNRTETNVTAECKFRVSGLFPEIWDPVSGERRPLPEFREENGRTVVPLRFVPSQSYLVIFSKGTKSKGVNFPEAKPLLDLQGSWTVTFDPRRGGPKEPVAFDSLVDWTTRPEDGIRHYSGIAIYQKNFGAPVSAKPAVLRLGGVNAMARVELNGRDLGVVWCAPWQVTIPAGLLKADGNVLKIHVANLWPNRMIRDSGMPENQRITKTTWNPYKSGDKLLPSGLIGPVTLLEP